MKAAQNGVPNVSVLDGWWDEGFEEDNGWAIGTRETDPDEAAQDWRDAQDLYRILEEQIVPSYYERDADGLPQGWLKVMRRAMASGALALLLDPDAPRIHGVALPAGGRAAVMWRPGGRKRRSPRRCGAAAASAEEPPLDTTASPVGTDAG